VVEESNLCGELKILKDFLLLGRGELFLAFIDQAKHLLKAPPTSTTQHGKWKLIDYNFISNWYSK
jgi:gamma-tubulin complex component 4